MSVETKHGKIKKFLVGVHPDRGMCLEFEFGGPGWGVSWFEPADKLEALLKAAGVSYTGNILNLPVEVKVEDRLLRSWRFFTEVM